VKITRRVVNLLKPKTASYSGNLVKIPGTNFGAFQFAKPPFCAVLSSFFSSNISSSSNSSLMVSLGDDSDVIARLLSRVINAAKINATYDKKNTQ